MARALLDRHLNQVRRRLLVDQALLLVGWSWVAALAVGTGWLLLQPLILSGLPEYVRWSVLAALVVLSTAGAITLAVWRRATPVVAALALDERFGLKERVTSTLTLEGEAASSPAGRALLADVENRLASVRVRDRFPITLPRGPLAMLPVAGLAVVLVAMFWNPHLEGSGPDADENYTPAVVKEDVDQQMKKLLVNKPKAKKPEDPAKAEQLEKIQADIEKFARGGRKNEEEVRERIKDATAIEEAIAKQQREQAERMDAFKEQMKQLDRLNRKADKDEPGPAKQAADALAQGDMKQAQNEMQKLGKQLEKEEKKERLERKIRDPKATEEEKKKAQEELDKLKKEPELSKKDRDQLAKQIEQMEEKLERLSRGKEEQKKDIQDKADKGEIDKEQLDRELDQIEKNADKLAQDKKDMQELAKQLGECKKCMNEGKDGEAAEKMAKAAEKAGQMCKDGECKGMEQQRAQVQAAKKALTRSLSNQGGVGAGKRPEEKDDNTGVKEVSDPGEFNKSKLEIVGSGPLGGFKGPRKPGEMQEEIRQAAQEAPAAIDRQRLPPAARKMARGYFERVRGSEKEKEKK